MLSQVPVQASSVITDWILHKIVHYAVKEKSKFHTDSTKIVHYTSHNSRTGSVCYWTPKKKRNICPSEESCNSFPISLSIRTWWKKNNSGYFRTATKVLQKENGPRVNSTWSEHFENFNLAGFSLSSATKKSRVQIQLQQPNKSFSTLVHSDGLRWKAAEAGIRETYTHSSQEVLEQEAFFPVAKDALLVRAA